MNTTYRMAQATLADLCTLVTDGTHDSPELLTEGEPFIKGKHINKGFVDFENCDYISHADHLKVIARSNPEKGDILFANIGNSIGDTAFVSTSTPFSIKNVALFKPDARKVNCRYLYYHVISHSFQDALLAKKSGSAQPFVGLDTLRSHTLLYHVDLHEQDQIESILSAYDDLIENNTRRIKILEGMAQALYREWFVHFRFPGHEKVKMVASPLGPIPEGWRFQTLEDVAINFDRMRRPLSSMQRSDRKGAYPYYGAARVFDYIDDYIFDGDYLLVAEDGSVITTDRKPVLQMAHGKFWANNHTHILQGRPPISTEFLYLRLIDLDISGYITGAAQPKVTQENLKRIPVLLPSSALLESFCPIVRDMFLQISNFERKNALLRRTRDLLLPKLVSGEIDVSNLDTR